MFYLECTNTYAVVCGHTGEILCEFPFPQQCVEYIRKHKIHGCVYPIGLRLDDTTYDELAVAFAILQARVRYYRDGYVR